MGGMVSGTSMDVLSGGIRQVEGKDGNKKAMLTNTGIGVDIEQMVNASVIPYQKSIDKLNEQIGKNNDQLTARAELGDKLTTLKQVVDDLRNPPGALGVNSNVFAKRYASATSTDDKDPSHYIGVTIDNNVSHSDFTVEVVNIATAYKVQLKPTGITDFESLEEIVVNADGSDNNFKAGTFSINGVDITLETGDTLEQVVSKVNRLTSQTGVFAETLKISDTKMELVLVSSKVGTANEFTILDADSILGSLDSTETDAEDAVIKVNGQAIDPISNNIITDVIKGVTITLLNENAAGKFQTITVQKEYESIKLKLKELEAAYNDLRQTIAKQQERDPKTNLFKDTAILGKARDNILDRADVMLTSQLNSTVVGISEDDLRSLADIGITFDRFAGDKSKDQIAASSCMFFDESKFEANIIKNFDQVRKVFEFTFTSNSSRIKEATRTNNLTINEFTLKINPDGLEPPYDDVDDEGNPEKVAVIYTDANGATVTEYADYSNGTITGRDGTAISGLKMYYAAPDPVVLDSIDVTVTQGLADRAFNVIEEIMSSTEGILKQDNEKLAKITRDLSIELELKEEMLEKKKELEYAKWAKFQSLWSEGQGLLAMLQKFADERYASS